MTGDQSAERESGEGRPEAGPGVVDRRGFLGLVAAAAAASATTREAAAVTTAVQAAEAPIKAGAAAVRITPALDRPVFIAGYDSNRIADSVHDDVWARALVLDDGQTRFALVMCDLIGLSNYRVRKIRQRIRGVPPENVLIACTHVHSGPDTLGLWGKSQFSSGLDPAYMERLEENIAAAVEKAVADLKPTTFCAGAATVPSGFVHNSREALQDTEMTSLRWIAPGGKTVATLIHYGGHPEVNKSKAITSDFVHYVREIVEDRFGGIAIFVNGALGGMVTPQVRGGENEGHNLGEMKRVGEGVGRAALYAVAHEEALPAPRLALRQKRLLLPLENEGFKLLAAGKVLDGEPRADGKLETEVWRVDMGPVTWVSIPGEILPRPALELKEKMPGKHRLVVALGNDELGYILHPEDFDRPLYKYEKSMSVGRETWPLLFAAAQELLR